MNEAINDSSKLIAQAIEGLNAEMDIDKPETWSTELNLKEIKELLEMALDKLAKNI